MLFYVCLIITSVYAFQDTVPLFSSVDLGHLNYLNPKDWTPACSSVSLLITAPQQTNLSQYQSNMYYIPYLASSFSTHSLALHMANGYSSFCHSTLPNIIPLNSKNIQQNIINNQNFPIIFTSNIPSESSDAQIHDTIKLLISSIKQIHPTVSVYITTTIEMSSFLGKREPINTFAKKLLPYSKRGIFGQYIFFNNAMYLGLLTMAILLLITILGISVLSGIQSPTRFETKMKPQY